MLFHITQDTNSSLSIATWEKWMKKCYLKTFWNCIPLEEEENELEIRGYRKITGVRERVKQHGLDLQEIMEKRNKTLGSEKCKNVVTLNMSK